MNWSRTSDYLMVGEHGYKVAKFKAEWETLYRASFRGQFIGQVKDCAKDAQQVCENHWAISGQFEKPDNSTGDNPDET